MNKVAKAGNALVAGLVEQARSAAYLNGSARRLRAQYPFFSEDWYLDRYPGLTLARQSPIVHYFEVGWQEGRQPHYLFWSDWYQGQHLGEKREINPLIHYLSDIDNQAKSPHPLFDPDFYRSQMSREANDASASQLWVDYLLRGAKLGLSPSAFFDPAFYLKQFTGRSDVVLAQEDALQHYLEVGFRFGLSPSETFDERFYQSAYQDVVVSDTPGLLHYTMYGRAEGRAISARSQLGSDKDQTSRSKPYNQGGVVAGIPNIEIKFQDRVGSISGQSRVNLFLPRLSEKFLTGGPNTALALIGLLAIALASDDKGQVRVIALDEEEVNEEQVRAHIRHLIREELPSSFEVVGCLGSPLALSETGEIFFATTWSTAQALNRAGLVDEEHPFWYLIQDFEPAFYPASSASVLAEETYSLPHRPVVNTPWLLDFLVKGNIGRFADPTHQASSLSFWPAIDRKLFTPKTPVASAVDESSSKTLVIYARPTTAPRNLFDIALAGVRSAHASGAFDGEHWDFVAVGDPLPPTLIADDVWLESVPWVSMTEYAQTLCKADVLVSLMASPHPSYPPLEAAIAGCSVVTNTWECKSAKQLAELIPKAHPTQPSILAVSDAVTKAVQSLKSATSPKVKVNLPISWAEAFGPIIDQIKGSVSS